MIRMDIEPGKINSIHTNEADYLIVNTRNVFVTAFQVFHFLILFDGNKPARVARTNQFIRPGAVMDLTNGFPIFVLIFAIGAHVYFSAQFLLTYSIVYCIISMVPF